MKKTRPMLRWAGIVLMVGAVISGWSVLAGAGAAPTGRPDQITINTLADFEKLELPPVTYFHDKHTEALAKEAKGCETCHFVEDNKLSFTFLRRATTRHEDIKDIYHANCIGCHNRMAGAGQKTGPLDGFCRSCHNADPPAPARLEAGMDKVLHFRHLDAKSIPAATAGQGNCGSCHHEYDKAAKKLVYVKGKEGSCRYCHLDKPQDGVASRQQAAHQQCLSCHQNLAKQGSKEPLPVSCGNCHGAAAQAELAKKNQEFAAGLPNREIPRLQRGQPDATLVMFQPKAGAGAEKVTGMPPVPFNHAVHEKASPSCRVCHHASMEACSTCHTPGGAKEGGMVTLEQSMHRLSSKHSCSGCHAVKQAEAKCAGCHNQINQAQRPDNATCQNCHMAIPGTVTSAQQKAGIAESLLKSRTKSTGLFEGGDPPDKVTLKELAKQFEPVELAHGKHVKALMEGMQDSRLAAYFHSQPGTMCQGCHHNSPLAKTPPQCISCHGAVNGVSGSQADQSRPGLMAALHGQCMSCHREMGVKPVATACTECHQKKQQQAASVR
jgi:hypothetical protein